MVAVHAWDVPDINPTVCKTSADDGLFKELAEVLKKHNALDRFGITLLHKHFLIGPDEALLETTDIIDRTQILTTVKRSDLRTFEAVETAWKLGENGEALWGCVCVTGRDGEHMGHRPTQ